MCIRDRLYTVIDDDKRKHVIVSLENKLRGTGTFRKGEFVKKFVHSVLGLGITLKVLEETCQTC